MADRDGMLSPLHFRPAESTSPDRRAARRARTPGRALTREERKQDRMRGASNAMAKVLKPSEQTGPDPSKRSGFKINLPPTPKYAQTSNRAGSQSQSPGTAVGRPPNSRGSQQSRRSNRSRSRGPSSTAPAPAVASTSRALQALTNDDDLGRPAPAQDVGDEEEEEEGAEEANKLLQGVLGLGQTGGSVSDLRAPPEASPPLDDLLPASTVKGPRATTIRGQEGSRSSNRQVNTKVTASLTSRPKKQPAGGPASRSGRSLKSPISQLPTTVAAPEQGEPVATVASPSPKRKRGRPRKHPLVELTHAAAAVVEQPRAQAEEAPVKRKRGRPPKVRPVEVTVEETVDDPVEESVPEPGEPAQPVKASQLREEEEDRQPGAGDAFENEAEAEVREEEEEAEEESIRRPKRGRPRKHVADHDAETETEPVPIKRRKVEPIPALKPRKPRTSTGKSENEAADLAKVKFRIDRLTDQSSVYVPRKRRRSGRHKDSSGTAEDDDEEGDDDADEVGTPSFVRLRKRARTQLSAPDVVWTALRQVIQSVSIEASSSNAKASSKTLDRILDVARTRLLEFSDLGTSHAAYVGQLTALKKRTKRLRAELVELGGRRREVAVEMEEAEERWKEGRREREEMRDLHRWVTALDGVKHDWLEADEGATDGQALSGPAALDELEGVLRSLASQGDGWSGLGEDEA